MSADIATPDGMKVGSKIQKLVNEVASKPKSVRDITGYLYPMISPLVLGFDVHNSNLKSMMMILMIPPPLPTAAMTKNLLEYYKWMLI